MNDIGLRFTFGGNTPLSYGYLLPPLLQLLELTLVAAVLTLLVLPLLYFVNALELLEAPELLIELLQLLDAIDDALEANGRPLRVLEGETARRSRSTDADADTNEGA